MRVIEYLGLLFVSFLLVNCTGFSSFHSSSSTARIAAVPGPGPGPGPTPVNSTPAQVLLNWTVDPASVQDAFLIDQSSDGVNFVQIQNLSGSTTTATVGGLARSATYYFRIRAVNSMGQSNFKTVTLNIP